MPYSIRTAIPPGTTSGPELADIVEEVGDLTQIVVESDTSNQPSSPSEGDAYIVNGDTSWVNGSQYDVAVFRDSTWIYHTPEEGWVAYIKDRSQSRRFNGTDWNSRLPDNSPEHATDSGTDAFVSATNTDVPQDGDTVVRDFQSANGTTTPTLDTLTITTKDGSALWAGALSGVHELQYDSSGPAWRVLDPNPTDDAAETADDATATLAAFGITTGDLSGTGIPGAIGRGAIVESGSNSNGSYVRWENGEQVCWSNFSFTTRSSPFTWTFPAGFTDKAIVLATPERGDNSTNTEWNVLPETDGESVDISITNTSSSFAWHFEARGYWK